MKLLLLSLTIILIVISGFHFRYIDLIGTDDVYWHIQYSTQNIIDAGILGSFSNPAGYTGFLFQFLLSLAVLIAPPLIASKIIGIVLSTSIFTILGFIMYKLRVNIIWLWLPILFLGSPNFSTRILFARTFLLSLIFLLIGIYCLIKDKKWSIFVTAILYGLSYSASPLLILAAGVWVLIRWVRTGKRNFYNLYIVTAGVLIGMIVNPAFPDTIGNLIRYVIPALTWLHSNELSGAELYGYPILTLIQHEILILLIWISSIIVAIIHARKGKLSDNALYIQILSILAFGGVLFARRFIEYWAPLAILASAITLSLFFAREYYLRLKDNLIKYWEMRFAFLTFIILLSFFSWRAFNFTNTWAVPNDNIDRFRDAGIWLEENSKTQDLVFNTSWTQYPEFFFWNPGNNYLVKLDPTSLYVDDEELYWYWKDFSDDKLENTTAKEIYQIVKYRSTASYILTQNDSNVLLHMKLNSDQGLFKLVHKDEDFSIYELKHNSR